MKKRSLLYIIAAAVLCMVWACVKDLEKEGISTTTQYIGTVVEKSSMQPVEGVSVQVTDGSHVYAVSVTDRNGRFKLTDVNFDELGDDCYLWLDGTALDLPSRQEPLMGLGSKVYDYKNIILYDKTNADLLPWVTTNDVNAIRALSARVSGDVTADGGHEILVRGICYATHQTPTLDDSVITAGTGLGEYSINLTNLTKSTTYYVRAYATNNIATTFGAQKMFTTQSGEATLSTYDATNITATSASIGGTVSDDGGDAITERGFVYAKTQEPTISDNVTTDGADTGAFRHTLQNLEPGITYYYRPYATNSCGTSYGPQKSFVTTNGLPSLSTKEISDITGNSAKGGGTITDNGGFRVTERGVCWNTTGNPDIQNAHSTDGSGDGTFGSNMTNLTPGTTYHVRAYATNSVGTAYGNELTFTTRSGIVSMTTTAASNITATSAKCGGNITDNAGLDVTERGICWNTTGNPDIHDAHVASGAGTGTFVCNMNNLSVNTTYHVRAYATNNHLTSYGNEVTFTTNNGRPTISIGNVNNITATTATYTGSVTSNGGIVVTAKGLCWSTTQFPTIMGSHSIEGGGNGTFTSSLTNLEMGTTYYVRAYATTSIETTYGEQISFTTHDGLPTVTTTAASLSGDNVVSGGHITDNGGFPITARGIVYGVYPNPDLTATYAHTNDGTGSGYFTSVVDINVGRTFYVRAYATNANGTSYGEQIKVDVDYLMLPTFVFEGHTYRVAPDPGFYVSWRGAQLYCEQLAAYSYDDWRLPTIDELITMWQYKEIIGGFRTGNKIVYHSSSIASDSSSYLFIIWVSGSRNYCRWEYDNGYSGGSEYTSGYLGCVRPIRVEN
ncbi:MAG: hypothetical protein IJ620_03120 [Bacteroidales bacterium]|nr:hypothetical protein [Bacteroidales bacterium]